MKKLSFKRSAACLSAIFLFALLFFVGACGETFTKSNMDYPVYENADEYCIGDKTYENNGEISSVNVDWGIGRVTLKHGDEFSIKELFSDLKEDKKVRSAVFGDELKIKFWKSGYSDKCDGRFGEKDVEITFPVGVNLVLNGVACVFTSSALNVKTIKTGCISGKFESDEITAESLKSSVTSAHFSVCKLNATEAEISSISGNVKIGEFNGKKLNAESTSGNVEAGLNSCESFFASTVSGNVKIELLNAENAGAIITFSTLSGKFKAQSDFVKKGDDYVFGGGLCKITVETTSGNLSVN